jgi:tetratricopeptide (TPR) repeat protein
MMTAEGLLREGIEQLKSGNSLKALSLFGRSFRLKDTPVCRSYLGLCIALERGMLREAIAMCEAALSLEPGNGILYLNLGKVYFKAGMRKEAIDTVRKGMSLGPSEEAIEWLNVLGIRRKPVFPFLSRKNPLNKYVGLLLSRLGLRGP